MDIKLLIRQNREAWEKYSGLRIMMEYFPEEYANLKGDVVLNDDFLDELDNKLIDLINTHLFPCFDPYYDFCSEHRERPYMGLSKISIIPMGFTGQAYCLEDYQSSDFFVYETCQEKLGYFYYSHDYISSLEQQISPISDFHPMSILPDMVRYITALTRNTWLDSHPEEDCEYDLNEYHIQSLLEAYDDALEICERLRFFDSWFQDNPALAKTSIEQIINGLNS